MPSNETPGYQAATDELQEIVAKLENEEINLDQLAIQVQRATELILFCKTMLKDTESAVQEVFKKLEE